MNSNTDLETLIQNQYLEFSIDLESEQPKILVVMIHAQCIQLLS